MQQDKVTRLGSEVGKNVWDEDSGGQRTTEQKKKRISFGQWWAKTRPTKTIVFWACLASVILTMIVGFSWGGWVTGGTAQKMAENTAIQGLVPVCVGQFNQDPAKAQKLEELKKTGVWQRRAYVEQQGWATIPGEDKPNSKVANECAKQLILISP